MTMEIVKDLLEREQSANRRRALSEEWSPRDSDEGRLFEACFSLAEAASRFERAATIENPLPVAAPTLGSLESALDSQATAMLQLRSGLLRSMEAGEPREQLSRLLFAINQN